VVPASPKDVVRDLVVQALTDAPGLFPPRMGGNQMIAIMHDAADRVTRELAANGFLPPDEHLDQSSMFGAIAQLIKEIPHSTLRESKRSYFTREEWESSAAVAVTRFIFEGLEKRGYRVTKTFLSAKPHGGNFKPR
jgi:hypothetical protein